MDSGDLELKQAYVFKSQQVQELHWAKQIWSVNIPLSKSLMVWRLMHGKMPTDENLMSRGCAITSMCNLCNNHVESSFHLFFECQFAIKLWSWLAGCLNVTLQFYSMEDMWRLCDWDWSPQSKVTITAAITNLLNILWYVRNQSRFSNVQISWRQAISLITAATYLSGNKTSKSSNNAIRDFSFLKRFRISIHPPCSSRLREVLWLPPMMNWIKCNIDGASSGNILGMHHVVEFLEIMMLNLSMGFRNLWGSLMLLLQNCVVSCVRLKLPFKTIGIIFG
jgi:hypothetical protein